MHITKISISASHCLPRHCPGNRSSIRHSRPGVSPMVRSMRRERFIGCRPVPLPSSSIARRGRRRCGGRRSGPARNRWGSVRADAPSRRRRMRRHHELPFGAEPTADGVRFRLWAPSASAVSLRIEDVAARAIPMLREENGWFSLTTAAARPGMRYRYVVGEKAVPDPASRRQPAGVHGPSEVVDPAKHVWSDLGWCGRRWEEIVLYELHVGAFSETGDFAGVIRHLDHIQNFGATAVELMPVAEFPGERNWGYDGTFLFAPAF